MDIVLAPHKDDMEYQRQLGENWYQEGMVINECHHMHDEWYK